MFSSKVSQFALASFLVLVALPFSSQEVITVTNGETEGRWGSLESCPSGSRAVGFQIKAELIDTPVIDDTGLNAIYLFCDDALASNISSTEGPFGNLQNSHNCPFGGYLVAFQLRVSPSGNTTDNTAANNINFLCSNDRVIGGVGGQLGYWGDFSASCAEGICGIETRVRPDGGIIVDNTSLNDARFTCCTAAMLAGDDE